VLLCRYGQDRTHPNEVPEGEHCNFSTWMRETQLLTTTR
jgi:hypothetical protein